MNCLKSVVLPQWFYETTNLQHLILPTFYSVLPLLHKRDIITQTSISQTSLFSFVFSSVSESCWLLYYTNHEWKHSLRRKYSLCVLLEKWSTPCHETILSRDSMESNSRYELVAKETRFTFTNQLSTTWMAFKT